MQFFADGNYPEKVEFVTLYQCDITNFSDIAFERIVFRLGVAFWETKKNTDNSFQMGKLKASAVSPFSIGPLDSNRGKLTFYLRNDSEYFVAVSVQDGAMGKNPFRLGRKVKSWSELLSLQSTPTTISIHTSIGIERNHIPGRQNGARWLRRSQLFNSYPYRDVVKFVDEKASRFHSFQQGRGGIPNLIQSKASRIHGFPRVSISN